MQSTPFPTKAFLLSVLWYLQNRWIFLVHSWKWNGKGSSTRILIQDGCSHGKITEVMGLFQRPSRKNVATVFRSHFSSRFLVSQTPVSIAIRPLLLPVAPMLNFSQLSLKHSEGWKQGMGSFLVGKLHLHCPRWSAACRTVECKTRTLRFQPRPGSLSWRSSLAGPEASYSRLGIYCFSNAGAKKSIKRIRHE